MESVMDSWNENEFIAYLLICAANADMNITDDERDMIIKICGLDIFKKVKPVFETQSDSEILTTIMSLKERFFPGDEGRTKILNLLDDLFKVDGNYSIMEKNLKRGLEKLI